MKILVVEDAEERIKWFKKRFENDLLIIVTNADDAIKKLMYDLQWDCIFLDHDLSNEDFGKNGFNERTGTEVAKFLNSKDYKGKIIIHSMNYYGMRSIQSYLPNSIVCQFPFLSTVDM